MLITELRIFRRKDISVPLFFELHPFDFLQDPIDKRLIVDHKIQYTKDKLMASVITTFNTLENFNTVVNLFDIPVLFSMLQHNKNDAIVVGYPFENYKILGIEQPITATTTYSFKTNALYKKLFINSIKGSDHFLKYPIDIDITDTSITLTEKFKNSTDLTHNRFLDAQWRAQLYGVQATRTINYRLT